MKNARVGAIAAAATLFLTALDFSPSYAGVPNAPGFAKASPKVIVDNDYKTSYGNFTYRIDPFRIVKANDRTVIVPTSVATLTLSTFYPFLFVGSASDGFIVTALHVN
jgi:hypothetical protein